MGRIESRTKANFKNKNLCGIVSSQQERGT